MGAWKTNVGIAQEKIDAPHQVCAEKYNYARRSSYCPHHYFGHSLNTPGWCIQDLNILNTKKNEFCIRHGERCSGRQKKKNAG